MRKMRRFALAAVLLLSLVASVCWFYAPTDKNLYPPGPEEVLKRLSRGANLLQQDGSAAWWMMRHERAKPKAYTLIQFKIVNAYGSKRITEERTIAARHDGAMAVRDSRFTTLTFVSDRREVFVNHADRLALATHLLWSRTIDLAYRPTAAPCLAHGSLLFPKNAHLVSWGKILEFSVMNYQWDSYIGRHTVSLAPALNCATLREGVDAYGEPPSQTWDTLSVVAGEPEASLFAIPKIIDATNFPPRHTRHDR
jgi:hypothetical protein